MKQIRNVLLLTGGGGRALSGTSKRAAFTMAEILLSLTIIGVVAAITLPSLTGNINERTWNTQRKALYARFSQAIALMPALNGYGKYSGTNSGDVVTVTEDTAAETFVTDGLAKVLKINNVCDAEHLADCGIVSSYNTMSGSKKNMPAKLSELNKMFTSTFVLGDGSSVTNAQNNVDTKAAAFETQNGESLLVLYNPMCVPDNGFWRQVQTTVCANFIYDLNGNKGPNTIGKDMGVMTAFYSTDTSVVAPIPANKDLSEKYKASDIAGVCTKFDIDMRLPNREELATIWVNGELFGMSIGDIGTHIYWSGSRYSADLTWVQNFQEGDSGPYSNVNSGYVRCVKR